jgi:hypothetical protein
MTRHKPCRAERSRRERRPFVDKPVATESSREHGVSDFLELIGAGLAGAGLWCTDIGVAAF